MGYSQNRLAQINNMASEAMRRKDYDQCIELLKQLSKLAPANWNVLLNIAQILISRYEFHTAEFYFERAIAITNDEASVCAIAVESYFNARQNDLAIKYLNRILKQNPNSVEGLTFLATIYEHQGSMALTSDFVDRALQLNPNYLPALLIKARLYRKNGRHEDAEILFRKISSDRDADINIRAESWCELGKLLDSHSRFDEAMSAFTAGKELLIPHSGSFLADRRRTRTHSKVTADSVALETLKKWNHAGSELHPHQRIALLGGHPRSGTTLLEQILDAHPRIVSLEESAIFFNEAYSPIIQNSALDNHLNALNSASPQLLAHSRIQYSKFAARFLGKEINDSLLIDKNPSLTPFIHAFARIFPECKFLIALRDPRDVCMSCFMQYLPNGPVASTFLTLQETINEYISLMETWQTLKLKIQNPYLEIRYEDLVNDFDFTTHSVLEFLEIPWDPRVLDFNMHAQSKSVHSPTYADVIKPIYKGAIGRWRNYQEYLEPYLHQLEPLIKAFGYE